MKNAQSLCGLTFSQKRVSDSLALIKKAVLAGRHMTQKPD